MNFFADGSYGGRRSMLNLFSAEPAAALVTLTTPGVTRSSTVDSGSVVFGTLVKVTRHILNLLG
jgi:hypothetical protein